MIFDAATGHSQTMISDAAVGPEADRQVLSFGRRKGAFGFRPKAGKQLLGASSLKADDPRHQP